MATTPRPRQERTIEYPTGDGNPMIEAELHRKNLGDLLEILSDRFADDPMVYVAADLVIYYEEGIPEKRLATDLFVGARCPETSSGQLLDLGRREGARSGHRSDLDVQRTSASGEN